LRSAVASPGGHQGAPDGSSRSKVIARASATSWALGGSGICNLQLRDGTNAATRLILAQARQRRCVNLKRYANILEEKSTYLITGYGENEPERQEF
jgi:hypothetical protein